jgi:hypothetical protein
MAISNLVTRGWRYLSGHSRDSLRETPRVIGGHGRKRVEREPFPKSWLIKPLPVMLENSAKSRMVFWIRLLVH